MNLILSNRANKIWMWNITGVTKYCSRKTELKTVTNQKPKQGCRDLFVGNGRRVPGTKCELLPMIKQPLMQAISLMAIKRWIEY